ncbi:MAG: PTS IIA-like nitrogen regulatory protein PtsN [Gammaproteobacteria bacterium]|nr:MAG: PTS IIA-like nitrogen regulatory protein PtsN [Gammaproteobacteria bacterium]
MSNTASNIPTSSFGDCLSIENVSFDAESGSKKRVLEMISDMLGHGNPQFSSSDIFDSLIAREKLGSTGIGHGVAIPHGRIKGFNTAVGAFVKLASGIDFDAIDGEPVDLVFVLLVPEESTEEHLQLLSSIAERVSDETFCQNLRGARTEDELMELLIH